MNIVDWFDPDDKEHMAAYETLCQTGIWPEGFIPDDMEFPHLWTVLLDSKLAKAWMFYVLNERVDLDDVPGAVADALHREMPGNSAHAYIRLRVQNILMELKNGG